MTEQDPRPADALTPAQAEAVRRLLAGARYDEGIPDDVVARLDATITELAAERVEGASADRGVAARTREAVVVPFRRRRWPQVLVAAAAVTIFGFGMAQIVGGGSGSDDAGAGSSADKLVEPEAATSNFGDDGTVDENSPQSAVPPRDSVGGLTGTSLKLDRESLSSLGIRGLRQLRPGAIADDLQSLVPDAAEGSLDARRNYATRAAALGCGPYYSVSGGETFAASYRRHLALVLFHPELDGVRLVEIYDCEGPTPRQAVRTVTLKTGE